MRLWHALAIGGTLALAARPARACDPAWLPIARPLGVAFFVATATGALIGTQQVHLQLAGGSATAVPRGSILLVPWGYGPDCRPIPWEATRDWGLPRTAAFYTGQLRPQNQWQDGLPTFDVQMAWREPLWQRQDPRWPHAKPGEKLLTPQEFFALYESLPTEVELKGSREAVLARLSAWTAKHRALALKEPAQTILANLRRALAGVEPDVR